MISATKLTPNVTNQIAAVNETAALLPVPHSEPCRFDLPIIRLCRSFCVLTIRSITPSFHNSTVSPVLMTSGMSTSDIPFKSSIGSAMP